MPSDTMLLFPYRLGNTWVFDEPKYELNAEGFVCGASEMVDAILATVPPIPGADGGFALKISAEPFDGMQAMMVLFDKAGGKAFDEDESRPWHRYRFTRETMDKVIAANFPAPRDYLQRPEQPMSRDNPITGWLCPSLLCYFTHAPQCIYAKAESLNR